LIPIGFPTIWWNIVDTTITNDSIHTSLITVFMFFIIAKLIYIRYSIWYLQTCIMEWQCSHVMQLIVCMNSGNSTSILFKFMTPKKYVAFKTACYSNSSLCELMTSTRVVIWSMFLISWVNVISWNHGHRHMTYFFSFEVQRLITWRMEFKFTNCSVNET